MAKSPQAALAKWKARMADAGKAMAEGVAAVTESPMQKAAAAVDKYQAGVRKAVEDGTFVAGLQAVPLEEWKRTMAKKGVDNMQNGVRDISARSQTAITDVVDYAQKAGAEVRAMPKVTEGDAKARMMAQFDKMKSYRKPR